VNERRGADESEGDQTPARTGEVDRRQFLRYAGATGATVATGQVLGARLLAAGPRWGSVLDAMVVPAVGDVPQWSLSTVVHRREDMVRLRFDFLNLAVDRTGSRPLLQRIDADADAVVVVTFPPQSLLEQAIPEPAGVPGPGSLGARLSGDSRLAFVIPPAVLAEGVPFTADGLLDWRNWLLRPALKARRAFGDERIPLLPDFPRAPTPPTATETSIEAPWWLQISPNRRAGFVAAVRPVVAGHGTRGDRTELWHARLATRETTGTDGVSPLSEAPSPNRVIRAVWSPDPQLATYLDNVIEANAGDVPFVTSLSQRDRISLIRLTTDDRQPLFGPQRPASSAVPVDTLTLSALGATMDLDATFEAVSGISLIEWRHRASIGRDAFVRVVDRGYLAPFGFPCAQVKITERRFLGNGTNRSAPLEQRIFLVVPRSRLVFGDDGGGAPLAGRRIPFRSVEMRATTTGNIGRAALLSSPYQLADAYHVLESTSNRDLPFHVIATDRDGRRHDLVMPMAFVLGPIAEGAVSAAAVRDAWNAINVETGRRWADLAGQKVAYATPLAARRGATSVTTDRMRWDLTPRAQPIGGAGRVGTPQFFPALDVATVRLEEVESLSANAFTDTRIRFDPTYVNDGFGTSNVGGVWATVHTGNQPGANLRFSRPDGAATQSGPGTDRSGGVLTPDLVINGLSRSTGVAAGDVSAIKQGNFDVAKFFGGPTLPTLLGGIPLVSVIQNVAIPVDGVAPSTALTISSRRTADAVVALMRWEPDLKSDPAGIFEPGAGTLRLDAEVRTPLDESSGSASSRVDGELRNVALNVPTAAAMLVRIELNRVGFHSRDGRAPDVDVDVRNVSFGGELAWIEGIRKYLNFGGDSGPGISVLPDRITAEVGVALPNITIGIFALRNIRFGAALDLPLTGAPARVRFALSSRENPFRLTVLCIGGGGYVGLAFGADGLEQLEVSLEGGAEIAVDFGPASGSVSMMFGIALLLLRQGNEETAKFLGYFRLNGTVSAGPVSASVTLSLELGYRVRTKNGKTVKAMYGVGTLEIDISVPLVPSPPITITFERSFRADRADPTFADQMTTEALWSEYCDAFAS
jgi:hypothetical protein